ncbi:hypothetical protein [Croceicoccus naphthovorans]|uniref:Uncharacterized protein n=1 Tax=Croceicoccus naphthovorans TaxID=1348774 RepID=A0A0G3XEE8_9SPHN|nr:hypothetical protein [Croceicoccus naphthovorans]AKM09532.1 hypothetical protein AB433_05325 [Croceicoccus naphthovorans]MBB3989720.1 putative membrane protein YgcG [Croceicoccus naphthovorans]
MNTKILFLAGSACLLAGCATYGSPEAGKFDKADFGEANRMTYAAMVVDPDPQYDEPMEGDGERAADAVEAYREGEVEIGTSGGGGMSGGGGGFSGGGSSSGGGF